MHRTCQGIRKQEKKKNTFLDPKKTTSKQDNLGTDGSIMGHITYTGYININ
jgi:hypothetical protein